MNKHTVVEEPLKQDPADAGAGQGEPACATTLEPQSEAQEDLKAERVQAEEELKAERVQEEEA